MAEFEELADEILEFIWEASPVSATFYGIHKHDGELDRMGREYLQEMNSRAKNYLAKLSDFSTESEEGGQLIDHTILTNALASGIKSFEEIREWEKNPGAYSQTVIYGVFLLTMREFAPLRDRVEHILSRLRQVPRVLEEGRANLSDSPEIFTRVGIDVTQGAIQFLKGIIPTLAAKEPELGPELLKANEEALAAFDSYLVFLKEEHLPRSKGEFAIGEALFNFKLKTDHMLPYDAEQLLTIGKEVLATTERDLETLATDIDAEKNWSEIVDELKKEHPDAGGLIEFYRKEMENARRFTMEQNLATIPEGEELEVIDTPVFERPTIPYAAYMPPAPFEKEQKGLFYVTPVDESLPPEKQEEQLSGHSVYKVPITALHEGYPGHHLQLVRSNRVPSKVRKMFSTSVFAEGWALYCEELMYDLGYYTDPRVRLMQLKDQLWRAARVIIDVSLHTRGMTFEEALDFLVEMVGLERVNALSEVKRYCATPTQPMSYVLGKLEIMKLRDDYQRMMGERFDLKGFHDLLLSFGTIPVALVRNEILG